MDILEFCGRLAKMEPMTNTERAVAVLWFQQRNDPGAESTAGEIRKAIVDAGLSDPHVTRLRNALKKHPDTLRRNDRFRLKAAARSRLDDLYKSILGPAQVEVDHDSGFLPAGVWQDTRGYVEAVCRQLNGCYSHGWHDAASVMLRRLVETLIIEVYEHEKRQDELKDADGHYKMLNALVAHASGDAKLHLGRESKRALAAVKSLGDRSAHNRRYTAKKADLDKIESELRVLSEELVVMANIRRKATT